MFYEFFVSSRGEDGEYSASCIFSAEYCGDLGTVTIVGSYCGDEGEYPGELG